MKKRWLAFLGAALLLASLLCGGCASENRADRAPGGADRAELTEESGSSFSYDT